MQTIRGHIFNIQRFSIHDGPGIRTTVFLKGCPLHCLWCHNPESQDREQEIAYYGDKCLGCGACVAECLQTRHCIKEGDGSGEHIYQRQGCLRCGRCASACPSGALSVIGRTVSAEEVIAEVERDVPFYQNSGGGMTVSGGEPFYQPEFTLTLLELAQKRGISCGVETSGAATEALLLQAVKLTDLFLYDIKETDSERYRNFTGIALEPIIHNLEALDRAGAKIVLRCPIIPGCNDRDDHFQQIGLLANRLNNIKEINVEPYHPLGLSKAAGIGKTMRFQETSIPSKEQAGVWAETVRAHTAVPVVLQ